MTLKTSEIRVFIGPLVALAMSLGCSQAPQQPAANTPQPTASQPPAGGADVTTSDASVDVGAVRVTLSVTQRPIVASEKRRFCVRTEVDAIQVDLTKGTLSFDTDPPAGANRYALAETPDGCYSADVTLPASPSGATRWYATVEGVVDEHPLSARFQFDVTK
jgi:hypothetical protein